MYVLLQDGSCVLTLTDDGTLYADRPIYIETQTRRAHAERRTPNAERQTPNIRMIHNCGYIHETH
jgi:hypothetical protein